MVQHTQFQYCLIGQCNDPSNFVTTQSHSGTNMGTCRLFGICSLGSAVMLGILGILKLALHLLKFSPVALHQIANVDY